MRRSLIQSHLAASCYFRTSVQPPYRKALLQITERCNLFCAHCFVSAGIRGSDMSVEIIRNKVLPRLKQSRVVSITLTGGEPFVHPEIIEIAKLFVESGIQVGICTNATVINEEQIKQLASIGNIR